jgi:hypothetical protein
MSSPKLTPEEEKAVRDFVGNIFLFSLLPMLVIGVIVRKFIGLPWWASPIVTVLLTVLILGGLLWLLSRRKLGAIILFFVIATLVPTYGLSLFIVLMLLFALGGHDWTTQIPQGHWPAYAFFLGAAGLTALLSWPIFRFWRKTILKYCG